MAAPRCASAFQKITENVWLFRQSTFANHLNQILRCRNCIRPPYVFQSNRQCSQFTIKAEQMDGNYKLKEDAKTGNDHDGKTRRFLAPYMERQSRYYQTRKYMIKKYQREGKASGIDPAIMWPTKSELVKIKAFEKEWCPSLQEMKDELEAERKQRRLRDLKRCVPHLI